MMRFVLLLLVAASAYAFQSQAFVAKFTTGTPFTPKSTTQLSSLNIMKDIKADFSGPNMLAGHPDDRPTMYPSKAGSLAFTEPQYQDYDVTDTGTSPVLASRTRNLGEKKSQWVSAIFWHEINLYGHTLASKGK